jgi:hypothetical protein
MGLLSRGSVQSYFYLFEGLGINSLVTPSEVVLASDVVQWFGRNPQIKCLNIAGNRESKNPGIGERVEKFLMAVFKRVQKSPAPAAGLP